MKILLTGADGFVGKQLFATLIAQGHEVIPMVLHKQGFKNEVVADFRHQDFVARLNSIPQVEAIIHFGALVDFAASADDLYAPNVLATELMVKKALADKSYLIFASSISVENPNTPYGQSKLLAEKLIQNSGAKYLILRISGVYGNNGPKHLGINKAIDEAIKGQVPTLIGNGQGKRNYIYVGDLAILVSQALNKKPHGIHYVGGPKHISIVSMLEDICAVFLPGKSILRKETEKVGGDLILKPSSDLVRAREFKETLLAIKKEITE